MMCDFHLDPDSMKQDEKYQDERTRNHAKDLRTIKNPQQLEEFLIKQFAKRETLKKELTKDTDLRQIQKTILNDLAIACKHGFVKLADTILKTYPELSAPEQLFELRSHWPGQKMYTLLMIAALHDQAEMAIFLMDNYKADVKVNSPSFMTALKWACYNKSVNVLREFLKRGAHPKEALFDVVSRPSNDSSTATTRRACTQLVLEFDSRAFEYRDKYGATVVLKTIEDGYGDILALLLTRGAKLEPASVDLFEQKIRRNPIFWAFLNMQQRRDSGLPNFEGYNLGVIVVLRAVLAQKQYEPLLIEVRESKDLPADKILQAHLQCYDATYQRQQGYQKFKAATVAGHLVQLIDSHYGFLHRDELAFQIKAELSKNSVQYQDNTALLIYLDDLYQNDKFTGRALDDPLRTMVFFCAAQAQAPVKLDLTMGLEMASLADKPVCRV